MYPQSLPTRLLCFSCLMLLFGCVKDVDVDQFNEIVVPPTIAVDLVHFDLDSEDLFEPAGEPRIASDKTRLDFLDDYYIQESLQDAEFNFVYTNTFERDLVSTVTFLATSSSREYSFVVEIPAGSLENPTVVDHTELIEEADIVAVRNSREVQVEVEMAPGSSPVEGSLNLQSKGFYKFEFQ